MPEAIVLLAYVAIGGIVVISLVYLYRTRRSASTPRPRGSRSAPVSRPPEQAAVGFQGSDFEWTPHGDLGASQTLELFRSLPWSAHLREFQHRESSGLEGCPPNLSLGDAASRRSLQVVCTDRDEFWLDLSSPESGHEISGLRPQAVEEVLQKFFSLDSRDFASYVKEVGSWRESR